jgi:hypothetical protein
MGGRVADGEAVAGESQQQEAVAGRVELEALEVVEGEDGAAPLEHWQASVGTAA